MLSNVAATRYIKLGRGGSWATEAIKHGIVPLGFRKIEHKPCDAADWDMVAVQLEAAGRSPTGVSQGIRELRDFYELGEDCLWITFASGHLYWTFAQAQVVSIDPKDGDGPHRARKCIGGWQRTSLAGVPLSTTTLSSALTRVAGYRMTICSVDRQEYALRKIRDQEAPLLLKARELQAALNGVIESMIASLDWRDFEVLVDLLFSRSGWQRQSAVGDGEVDLDLALSNQAAGETARVQIKSQANQPTLDDYLNRFRLEGGSDHFFFVCHSSSGLTLPAERGLHLWSGHTLAQRVLATGLVDWVMQRAN